MTITSSHTRKFIHAEKDEPPVCRTCYWKAWLCDQNRMLLGAPLGRRSRCRDAEEARAFANDYGYDLVSLLVPGMNCAPIVGRCLLGYRLRPRWTLSGIPPGCVHRVVSGVVWCSSG